MKHQNMAELPSEKALSPREKAEQKLHEKEAQRELSSKDRDFLIHELAAHQVELEMQNENLRTAQLELETVRRNYADLYDFAPVGFFSFDQNGLITDINATGLRILGASDKALLINQPFSRLIEDASADRFHSHIRSVIACGTRQSCEVRIKRKDGSLFDAELQSISLNSSACRTAVSDITMRKAYDRILIESTEQYRALVEASPESIAVCEAGHFVYINPAGLELFGAQDAAEVVGKTTLDFVHPDFRPDLQERFRDVEENGQVVHSHDMKILRMNGQTLDVEVMANPIAFNQRNGVQLIIKDISDRKETELRLRLQGTVLSQVSDAVIAVGNDGRIIFWNRGAERLYKLTAQEAIGKQREEIYRYRWLTPADERAARQSMAATGFLRGENVHILKDGEQIYVESSVSVLTDWSNAPVGWIAVMRDVTERKIFERKLKESEERYRSLVESAPDAILVHQDGKLVYANPATLKLMGARDLDQLIGENALDFAHPDLHFTVQESTLQAEEGLPLPARESKVVRLDGGIVYIEAVGTHITYGGKPAIQIIAKDVTERKEFEKALRNSEKLYRLMFESNPHPMWIYDTDTLRFLFVNDTAVNQYGYSKEEFLSMSIKDIRSSEDASVLFDNVSKIARGLYDEGTWRHKKKDGTIIDVEIISHSLKIEGKDARVILAHDVTKRKQAERALRESEERQRAVFDNSPLAIIAKDLQGRHIIFNRQAEKWMNVRREDVLGKTVYDFLPRNEADRCIIGDRTVIESRAPVQEEEVLELPDGLHTHLTVKFPLFDAAGSLYAVCCVMSDITEMKRAEQAFRESEERQRAVFDNSPIAIFAKDLQGRFILWNRQAELWMGKREDDILGKTDYDLFPKEVADRLTANDRRVIESGCPVETEEVTQYGGKERIYLDIKFPLFDSSGQPYAVCGISSDITERKRAEQQIKEARDAALRDRRKLEIILNTIPSGVFVAEGPDGVITHQNEQTFQILGRNVDAGVAASDRIGKYEMTKSDGTLFKPRELPYLRALLNGEQVRDVEMTFCRPDGRKLTVLVNAAPLRDSDGNITASVTAFNDISERKEAEDALKRARIELELRVRERTAELAATVAALQSEIAERKRTAAERDKLVAAVESTAEAIVVTDNRGIIQYVNPSFEEITGYPRQEAIGRDLHFLDSGQHDEDFFPRMRETIRTEGVWKGRLINKKKDGSIYYEDCTYSPVRDRSGTIVNYVSIKHDVTEKLRLESIAETVDAMNNIGYVFSGIRHEIGNPVSSLLIILSLLKKKYDTNPNDTIREYVDQAISQVDRIEYLLKSLKNFNMYENLQIRNAELSSFLEKFIPLVAADLTKKGITFQIEAPPQACWMSVDPRALQQALVNVIVNASEAVTGRPDPTVVLSSSKFGGMVQIRVADNGMGISEDRKKDLFKPFYTTKSQGTGLGLVITRKLVSRMKGFIEIASRTGEGTTVDIYLPEGTVERDS